MTNVRPPVVVSVGEALVDFLAEEIGDDLAAAARFVRAQGGAVANVAAGLARMGATSRFIGKVGDDPFGRYLAESLRDFGVDVSGVAVSDKYPTGLVFAILDEERTPRFYFFGDPSADMTLDPAEVGAAALEGADFLHCGTVSMVGDSARAATRKLMELARGMGVRLSFDPNLRLHLWKDHGRLRDLSLDVIAGADLVKLNRDELEFLTGAGVEEGALDLLDRGAGLAVVTLGAKGAYWRSAEGEGYVGGFSVGVADTTGAGDGFASALLATLGSCDKWPPGPAPMGDALALANAAAAIVTTSFGAVSSLPTLEEAREFAESGRLPERPGRRHGVEQ